jgi:hypothetical protein
MDNHRTETARETDDSELIESMEEGPSFGSASGGQLQRDIGSRDEIEHEDIGGAGTTRVRASDKQDGDTNLPRYNEK